MLQTNKRPLFRWADKTLSMLKAQQLEACEKELAGLPSVCLFDAETTDMVAEDLFDISYYAQEPHSPSLHSIEELRSRVMDLYPSELAMLCPEEHELVVKLALCRGRLPLWDWDSLIPARSLVRRLWCRVEKRDQKMTLIMPMQLCLTALFLMSSDAHRQVREIMEAAQTSIDDSLYLQGAIQANAPEAHLASQLSDTFVEHADLLIRRFLLAGYQCYRGAEGLLLLHPGLADPASLSLHLFRQSGASFMDERDLQAALESLDQIEDPLYDHLTGLLQGMTRPEISAEDAAEDLILLVKQNVPYPDLVDVLRCMLVTLPTQEMLDVIRDISVQVPRWVFLNSSRLQ